MYGALGGNGINKEADGADSPSVFRIENLKLPNHKNDEFLTVNIIKLNIDNVIRL